MKRIVGLCVLLVLPLGLWAHGLEVESQAGSFVRVGGGEMGLQFAVAPGNEAREIRLSCHQGASEQMAWQGRIEVPRGCKRTTATLALNALGVYFVEAQLFDKSRPDQEISSCTVTLAAIADNRHSAVATTSPFAMGCYFAMRFSPEQLSAAAHLAALAGVSYSREELRWDICEPARGSYQWKTFDRGIDACMRNHIGVLGLLDYWGAFHDEKTTMSAEAVGDYAGYVAACVSRYKPQGTLAARLGWKPDQGIQDWEIWNEPATFWFLGAEAFGSLTAAAFRSAHRADAACRVYFANADEVFDATAMHTMGERTFDGITPHFYAPPRSPKDAELMSNLRKLIRFFSARGHRVPMWISEMGWYSDDSPSKQQLQADYLVQSYLLALAAGYDKVFWYNFVCDAADKHAAEYGLLNREDLSPKIGYAAFAGMVNQLEGARFVRQEPLGRNVVCLVFAKPDGQETACVWAEEGEGSLLMPAGESRRARLKVCDMFGNVIGQGDTSVPLANSPHFVHAGGGFGGLWGRTKICGIPQVDVRLSPTSGTLGAGKRLQLVVENFTGEAAEVKLSLKSPQLETEPLGALQVEAHSSATATVMICKFVREPSNRYPVDLEYSVAGGGQARKHFVLAQKVAVRGSAQIDGDLKEWGNAAPFYLNSASQAVGINPYMAWNLSARYCMMWDEENLYFAARVRDNAHCQPQGGKQMWEGDSWQLAFRTLPGALPGQQAKGLYCYGLCLSGSGGQTAVWEGGGDAAGIKLVVKRVAAGEMEETPGGPTAAQDLVYECAIPRALLAPLRMIAGESFGFSTLLNDNDGGGRSGWMESTPGIGTGLDPAKFDIFQLQ